MRWCGTRALSASEGLLEPTSKCRYTWTLSQEMISPSRASAKASARADLPDAVGPTTTASSASAKSMSSTPNLALQLIPPDPRDDGAPVRTMPREIDVIERDEKSARLGGRKSIAGAYRAMARHRGQDEVDRVREAPSARARDLGDEIADHTLGLGARQEARQGVDGHGGGSDCAQVEPERGEGGLLLFDEGGVARGD